MTTRISRDKQLDYYMKLPYATNILAYECDGKPCYMAVHPELEGCMAQGDSPANAVQSLADARRDYINAMLDEGLEIPLPTSERTSVIVRAATSHAPSQVFTYELPETPASSASKGLTQALLV